MPMYISNLVSYNRELIVNTHSATPYYNPDNTNFYDGAVRTCKGELEYYDAKAKCWYPLPGLVANIDLHTNMNVVLNWAMKKMDEEEKLKKLAEKYPALKQAKENYEIVKALVQNETD